MSKFKLDVAPTFKAAVEVPVHGGESASVVLEFKHRTKDDLTAWLAGAKERNDVDALTGCIVGWDLDEPFNPESVALLVQNYAGAAPVIVERYLVELIQARRKN